MSKWPNGQISEKKHYICDMFKNGHFVGWAKDTTKRYYILEFSHQFWVGAITYVMHCTEVEFIEAVISQRQFEYEFKKLVFDVYFDTLTLEEFEYEIECGAKELLCFDL